MLLIDSARAGFLFDADRGGLAYYFAHHSTGFHNADWAQARLGDADIASGHEEVVDVSTIKATVRSPVETTVAVVLAAGVVGNKFIILKSLLVRFFREVKVDVP